MSQPNDLPYTAYALKREGRNPGRWIAIGRGEEHRDGKGLSLFLDSLPTGGFDGRVVVRLNDAPPASPGPIDEEEAFWSPKRP